MRIDVWSDIACPWCAVGKSRFAEGLALFEHRDDVEVTWRSFQLDPTSPPDQGEAQDVLLARKYGCSLEEAQAMDARMTESGAEAGWAFRFDRVRVGNTFDAHRLHHLAAARGLAEPMMTRLMKAYLEEGVLMADSEALVRLGTEVGLPECDVRFMLAGDAYADAVREDLDAARALGITGVPFFVFEGKYGVSGAQPAEAFRGILGEVWERERPFQSAGAGEACGPDGCAV